MTTKRALSIGLAAFLAFSVFIISCKKDSDKPKMGDSEWESTENNAFAEASYNDANSIIDLAFTSGTNMSFREDGGANLLSGCVTVTLDTAASPKTITVDFGSTNCLCLDGRNRRGKIIATYTGKYKDAGTVINISFDNYFVNDNQVKGTHKTTNLGLNNGGNLVYKIEVNGSIVKSLNRGTVTWVSTREREWTAGANTPLNPLDDQYSITGTASGTNADESAYSIAVTQPLVCALTCRWFKSGKLTLTPAGGTAITLDYGNGNCDANATVTISGITFNVVLP